MADNTDLTAALPAWRNARSITLPTLTAIGIALLLTAGLLWLVPAWTASPLLGHVLRWLPALLWGMLANIQISVLAIALGTAVGLVIGALQLSPVRPVARVARWYVQIFRNAPMLILIYFSTYVFPFEIRLGSTFPTGSR